MIDAYDLLWGGVAPAVLAAGVLAAVWLATGKAASAWRSALVVGYVAGHWALEAHSTSLAAAISRSYHPQECRDWLPLLILLATVPDAIACVGKYGPAIGWVLRAGLCLLIPWRLTNGTVYLPAISLPDFGFESGAWSTPEMIAWIVGVGAVLAGCWSLVRIETESDEQTIRSTLVALVVLAAAPTMVWSASLIYGKLFVVLASTLAGCGVASSVLRTGRGPEAAAGPLMVSFGCLVLLGYFFAELRLYNALLLLAAMTVATGRLPRAPQRTKTWKSCCRAVLCLPLLVAAMLLAYNEASAKQAVLEENPYRNFQPQ